MKGHNMSTNVHIKDNKLIIETDLLVPYPSKSGKTLLVATSSGNMKTEAMVGDKQIILGFTAYIRKDG